MQVSKWMGRRAKRRPKPGRLFYFNASLWRSRRTKYRHAGAERTRAAPDLPRSDVYRAIDNPYNRAMACFKRRSAWTV
jgi:hypothetical protein